MVTIGFDPSPCPTQQNSLSGLDDTSPKNIPAIYLYLYIYIWLVVSTSLKNMKVSWDYYSQLNGKIKK
jgi:hypothetical protein